MKQLNEIDCLEEFCHQQISIYFKLLYENPNNNYLPEEPEIPINLNDPLIWFIILNDKKVHSLLQEVFYDQNENSIERWLKNPNKILLITGISSLNIFVIHNFISDLSSCYQFQTVQKFVTEFLSDKIIARYNYSLNVDDANVFHLGIYEIIYCF